MRALRRVSAKDALERELKGTREALEEVLEGFDLAIDIEERVADVRRAFEREHPPLLDAAQLALEALVGMTHSTRMLGCAQAFPSCREAGDIALQATLPSEHLPLYLDISPDGYPMSMGFPDPEAGREEDFGEEPPLMTLAAALIFTVPGRRVVLPFGSVGDELDVEVRLPVVFGEGGHPGGEVKPTRDAVLLRGPDFSFKSQSWMEWQSVALARLTMDIVEQLQDSGTWAHALAAQRSEAERSD